MSKRVWIKKIALVFACLCSVVCFCGCERLTVLRYKMEYKREIFKVVVDGNSMQKTMQDGEEYFAYRTENGEGAERGDIIVVYVGNYAEYGSTEFLVKRLIAIEGDKVRCTDGQVEIMYANSRDWTVLDEPYAYYTNPQAYDFAEYTVGENEVFFLGDNRNNSLDSRYKENGSRLDRLLTEADVYGVVINAE